jgi:cytoskeleton protein RodZ
MSESGNDSGARKGGIGARLQAARTRANLSLVQAAEQLHVDPDVVHALETETFDDLGAAVYVRGHLQHYAQLVNESVPELLGLYASNVHASAPPDLTRMPHPKQISPWRGAMVMGGLAVAVAIGLIGGIRWIYRGRHPGSAVPTGIPAIVPVNPISAPAAHNS